METNLKYEDILQKCKYCLELEHDAGTCAKKEKAKKRTNKQSNLAQQEMATIESSKDSSNVATSTVVAPWTILSEEKLSVPFST